MRTGARAPTVSASGWPTRGPPRPICAKGHDASSRPANESRLRGSQQHSSATLRGCFVGRDHPEEVHMGVDPNKVRLTGENSFLVLSEVQGGDPTVQNSHWRIHHSPKGPGHVLFTRGAIHGGEARIYSDNIALARWLQEGVQGSMR